MTLGPIKYDLQPKGLLGDYSIVVEDQKNPPPPSFKTQPSLDEEDYLNEVWADLHHDLDAVDLIVGSNRNPLFRSCKALRNEKDSFPTSSAAWPRQLAEYELLVDTAPQRDVSLKLSFEVQVVEGEEDPEKAVPVTVSKQGTWCINRKTANSYWAEQDECDESGDALLRAMETDTKGIAPPGWSAPVLVDMENNAEPDAAGQETEEQRALRNRNKEKFFEGALEKADAIARGDLSALRSRSSRAPIKLSDLDPLLVDEVEQFDFESIGKPPAEEKAVHRTPPLAPAPPVEGLDLDELARDCGFSRWDSCMTEMTAEESEPTVRRRWVDTKPLDVSNFHEVVPDPALTFPFELDGFQKQAVARVERNENVFVAAHTSAGKTVVADYAIALSKRRYTRVLYTSPIKTLSNQKFRDFREKFGDVGILTGDVQINPTAACLVMTTEILRSMLYRDPNVCHDVEYVIFDEVHYINDPHRGFVWEEVIILLPKNIKLIMLSATVPNYEAFADWVGRVRKAPVHVVTTMKRPVPLRHSLWYQDQEYVVLEAGKGFDTKVHKQVADLHNAKMAKMGGGGGPRDKERMWPAIIQYLKKQERLPVIIFAFSKNMIDSLASYIHFFNFTSKSEKSFIEGFLRKALKRLNGSDRSLPQIQKIFSLLRHGIGVHHAGLMPILKEVVEVLFCQGVIRVLFATETFAMGVNAPARSVVFASTKKHDGSRLRELLPGEYTQMSGRAGRRGLDKVGYVMLACNPSEKDSIPDAMSLQRMMAGRPLELESKFRLTYSLTLNSLMRTTVSVGELLRSSFGESRANKYYPVHCALREKYESEASVAAQAAKGDISQAQELYKAMRDWVDATRMLTAPTVVDNKAAQQTLVAGKVVVVEIAPMVLSLGYAVRVVGVGEFSAVILNNTDCYAYSPERCGVPEAMADAPLEVVTMQRHRIVCTLNKSVVESAFPMGMVMKGKPMKAPIQMGNQINVNDIPGLLKHGEKLRDMLRGKNAITHKDVDKPKVLRAAADAAVIDAKEKQDSAMALALSSPAPKTPTYAEDMKVCHTIADAERRAEKYRNLSSDENLYLMPEFQARVEVLRELGYIEETVGINGMSVMALTPKGTCATCINSVDSLLGTELIFEGVFDKLSHAQCVGLLAALVCSDSSLRERGAASIPDEIPDITEIVRNLADFQKSLGVPLDVEQTVEESVNYGISAQAMEWASGAPFSQVAAKVREGTLIRDITRIDGVCREFAKSARQLGDSELEEKMLACSNAIRRDIVFCPSLYLEPPEE